MLIIIESNALSHNFDIANSKYSNCYYQLCTEFKLMLLDGYISSVNGVDIFRII